MKSFNLKEFIKSRDISITLLGGLMFFSGLVGFQSVYYMLTMPPEARGFLLDFYGSVNFFYAHMFSLFTEHFLLLFIGLNLLRLSNLWWRIALWNTALTALSHFIFAVIRSERTPAGLWGSLPIENLFLVYFLTRPSIVAQFRGASALTDEEKAHNALVFGLGFCLLALQQAIEGWIEYNLAFTLYALSSAYLIPMGALGLIALNQARKLSREPFIHKTFWVFFSPVPAILIFSAYILLMKFQGMDVLSGVS